MWLLTISSISSAIIDQFLSLTEPHTGLDNSAVIEINGIMGVVW